MIPPWATPFLSNSSNLSNPSNSSNPSNPNYDLYLTHLKETTSHLSARATPTWGRPFRPFGRGNPDPRKTIPTIRTRQPRPTEDHSDQSDEASPTRGRPFRVFLCSRFLPFGRFQRRRYSVFQGVNYSANACFLLITLARKMVEQKTRLRFPLLPALRWKTKWLTRSENPLTGKT